MPAETLHERLDRNFAEIDLLGGKKSRCAVTTNVELPAAEDQ
tara:strand:+ start:3105 stop:3230 length:126 start_codon:yes stop_codon:yes gene_type:complete